MPKITSSTYFPRSVGLVREVCEVSASTAPMPSSPPRCRVGRASPCRISGPVTPGDAVVLGEVGVHVGVVGVEQVEDAAVLGAQAVEERRRLVVHRLAQLRR